MPRANRHFLAGYIWHITHRCHKRQFLLKFARDRKRWRYWLYEARKRYGLRVLNYIVTSNHIHLLVRDREQGEIHSSMQLIASRTGQEYNQRKKRLGAYWQDRYHATAVDTEGHFARCMTYIDLNMVRAGAVSHPVEWAQSGYCEILNPPQRYRVLDIQTLLELLDATSLAALQNWRRDAVNEALEAEKFDREAHWSEALAVGSNEFVHSIQARLGPRAFGRSPATLDTGNATILQDPSPPYSSFFDPKLRF